VSKPKPQNGALTCLKNIVDALQSRGEPLTATTLKRYHNCESPYFDEAANYGHDIKVIRWGSHNKFTLLKEWQIPESFYYESCKNALQDLWGQFGFHSNEYYIEKTAKSDSRIAGPWTRPDLTLISHKRFEWTIGSEFDVVTFEVKRPDSCNVLAVFEALAHASAATKAYAVFALPEVAWRTRYAEQAPRVVEECGRHGVGLIFIDDPLGTATAVHHLPAQRRQIDNEKSSSFLDAVLNNNGKGLISKWKS